MNVEKGSGSIEVTTPSELDQRVVSLRIAGISTARIAIELELDGPKAVTEALERGLPKVDADYRSRVIREELARLDQLQSWWFGAAKNSAPAAQILLKIAEQRAMMLGLDAPQQLRTDPIRIISAASDPQDEGGTALLLRELNRIAGERKPNGDAEAELVPEVPPPGS